jgi:hypothetical protein
MTRPYITPSGGLMQVRLRIIVCRCTSIREVLCEPKDREVTPVLFGCTTSIRQFAPRLVFDDPSPAVEYILVHRFPLRYCTALKYEVGFACRHALDWNALSPLGLASWPFRVKTWTFPRPQVTRPVHQSTLKLGSAEVFFNCRRHNPANSFSHAAWRVCCTSLQREYGNCLGQRDVVVISCQARSFTRKFA